MLSSFFHGTSHTPHSITQNFRGGGFFSFFFCLGAAASFLGVALKTQKGAARARRDVLWGCARPHRWKPYNPHQFFPPATQRHSARVPPCLNRHTGGPPLDFISTSVCAETRETLAFLSKAHRQVRGVFFWLSLCFSFLAPGYEDAVGCYCRGLCRGPRLSPPPTTTTFAESRPSSGPHRMNRGENRWNYTLTQTMESEKKKNQSANGPP